MVKLPPDWRPQAGSRYKVTAKAGRYHGYYPGDVLTVLWFVTHRRPLREDLEADLVELIPDEPPPKPTFTLPSKPAVEERLPKSVTIRLTPEQKERLLLAGHGGRHGPGGTLGVVLEQCLDDYLLRLEAGIEVPEPVTLSTDDVRCQILLTPHLARRLHAQSKRFGLRASDLAATSRIHVLDYLDFAETPLGAATTASS